MALGDATKHALWVKRLLRDLKAPAVDPMFIYGHNKGALFLARDPVQHQRTKHIDIRHHFIREKVASGEIDLRHIPTAEMVADIMTKGLAATKHLSGVRGLGLQRAPEDPNKGVC